MNIQKNISEKIKSATREIFNSISSDIIDSIAIEVPKQREFGDFSTNAAMVLARPLAESPRAISEKILPEILKLDFVANADIAGPGFINIKLKDEFIISAAAEFKFSKTKNPAVIDLDYGGYNIGKNLHIGHLRTTVVGDTFNRIAKHIGHKTKSYNHMGDWGRPMGLIIAWILEYEMPKNADDVNKIYPESTARAKDDANWLCLAKKITAELQAGNKEYRKIYDMFAPMSLAQVGKILKRLNILPFDENRGERLIAEYIPQMQKILKEKNLLLLDDGAEIIPIKLDSDKAPMPPVMWRSSAGAQTYAAADLTAIYYRAKTDAADAIIYFTDSRQNLHFTQIFRAAKLCGIDKVALDHIGFGAITGPDGKPFKTRDGSVPSLDEVLDMVNDSVRARVAASDKVLPDETIDMIALAALKFNDLAHDVKSDYIFDADTLTSFEGRTGPYILYTAVRLNSILKKVGNIKSLAPKKDYMLSMEERELLLSILDFNRVIDRAFDTRGTDILANYAYDLCQNINTFYHNHPIMRDDIDENTRTARLWIVEKSLMILTTAIGLMGLCIPDEM